ncbi:MAG: hypothetical protein ABIN01_08835 [Ferruginibacter sp.]
MYTTSKITDKADCDLLLSMANKEKADLDFKILSEQRQQKIYGENAVEIDADLQLADAEISATQTIINSFPDGDTKDDAVKKLTRLQYRKFLAEGRKENYGGVAYLTKEMDLARLSLELSEVGKFIDEINARKLAI